MIFLLTLDNPSFGEKSKNTVISRSKKKFTHFPSGQPLRPTRGKCLEKIKNTVLYRSKKI